MTGGRRHSRQVNLRGSGLHAAPVEHHSGVANNLANPDKQMAGRTVWSVCWPCGHNFVSCVILYLNCNDEVNHGDKIWTLARPQAGMVQFRPAFARHHHCLPSAVTPPKHHRSRVPAESLQSLMSRMLSLPSFHWAGLGGGG